MSQVSGIARVCSSACDVCVCVCVFCLCVCKREGGTNKEEETEREREKKRVEKKDVPLAVGRRSLKCQLFKSAMSALELPGSGGGKSQNVSSACSANV